MSKVMLGLHEIVRLAKEIPEPEFTAPPNASAEGLEFLKAQGVQRFSAVGYTLISMEMRSPLAVVLEIPPEAMIAFGFALLALAERVATAETRVSKKRARDLRDKSAYDRERTLIESGRIDMAVRLLKQHPRPSLIEIVGGDESFSEAEPIQPDQSKPSGKHPDDDAT